MPTAIITGVSGYIGSKLAKRLIDEGWDVTGIKRPKSSLQTLKGYEDKLSLYNYDGTYDSLDKAFAKSKVDCVFHIASWYLREHQEEQISDLLHSNISFSTLLVEAALNNNCGKFINTSTFTLFSEESSKYAPDSLYSASKKAFSDILKYYVRCKDLSSINLFLYDNYGADDHRKKLFWLFNQSANHGRNIDFTEGVQKLCPIYIDDTIDAYIAAYNLLSKDAYKQKNLEYFVSGEKYTLKEIAAKYEEISGKKLNINWGAIPYRDDQIMVPYSGETLPNWKQKISLEEGLRLITSSK